MNEIKRSSYENRELLHETLRSYMTEVLANGQQSKTTEMVITSAFESILKTGSANDIEWAIKRISRAIAALDEGDYATIHAHQENFERMIQALGFQKTIATMAGRAYG